MNVATAALKIASRPRVVSIVARLVRGGAVSQGPRDRARYTLTFDDGPHPTWTPKVLDALDAAGAKATFFVVGKHVARHPEIVRETRERGHEIGSHLYAHHRAVVQDERRFGDELRRSLGELEDVLGERIRFLRFPYGDRGAIRPADVTARYGVTIVHWTFSAHDGFASEEQVVARVGAGIRAGAIVLLHDALADEGGAPSRYVGDRTATVAAVPRIVGAARRRGLAPVTLGELLAPMR